MPVSISDSLATVNSVPVIHAFGDVLCNPSMRTINEIRHANLLLLIDEYGSLAELNDQLGLPRTDATLSQIKNRSKDSKTGKPRVMGDVLARRMEAALGKQTGWMDNPQYKQGTRGARVALAVQLMERMPDWQVDQAIKILDTIAEPPARTGTDAPPTDLH